MGGDPARHGGASRTGCLYAESDLIDRTVRDFLTDDVDSIMVDDQKAFERMQNLVGQISKRARKRVQLYTGTQPIFDCFGVQSQIDAAFHRQVWLPCGGYIVIDETEALIAVDVNTGRNKGSKDMEKTILRPTSRRRTRFADRCACAISAASSSRTSST